MKQIFTIIPSTNAPMFLAIGVAAFNLILAGLFIYLAASTRQVRFEVTPGSLKIAGDMFGRTIPISVLDLDAMRAMNLNYEREYLPRWRRMGTGLPGYAAGWFSLRNGEKSLIFMTDRSCVVHIPTSEGYSVMLSTERPEEFMAAVRTAAQTW